MKLSKDGIIQKFIRLCINTLKYTAAAVGIVVLLITIPAFIVFVVNMIAELLGSAFILQYNLATFAVIWGLIFIRYSLNDLRS